ncbi:MAG TPA: hypothetical protein VKU82_08605 [Planctomycetaceae bacterium]|nr:hypothetical protein [Planctomycetaceae bacterium]
MRRVFPIFCCSMALIVVGALSLLRAADDDKPKKSVKEVMKQHKDLVDKVKKDTASAEEKKQLVELYTEMSKNKAPSGEADSWKKMTEALVKASKDLSDGKDGAKDAFVKAVDCGKCHTAHKPKK